jgi:hypothetical protein
MFTLYGPEDEEEERDDNPFDTSSTARIEEGIKPGDVKNLGEL